MLILGVDEMAALACIENRNLGPSKTCREYDELISAEEFVDLCEHKDEVVMAVEHAEANQGAKEKSKSFRKQVLDRVRHHVGGDTSKALLASQVLLRKN